MNFNAPKNIFNNWNKDMYIATKKDIKYDKYNNQIIEYNEPFYFGKINYQPLTGKNLEAYMQTYGETTNNIVSCLIDNKNNGKFSTFDLAYLYGVTPNGENKNGENANYKVRAYKPQNTKIMVILEEIIKEVNDNDDE